MRPKDPPAAVNAERAEAIAKVSAAKLDDLKREQSKDRDKEKEREKERDKHHSRDAPVEVESRKVRADHDAGIDAKRMKKDKERDRAPPAAPSPDLSDRKTIPAYQVSCSSTAFHNSNRFTVTCSTLG